MPGLELFLKVSLLTLLFLGLAEACVSREVAVKEKIKLLKGILGMMSRLSVDDKTEEEMKILKQILGLLSLQVLNEETNDCNEEVKLPPTTTPTKKPPRKRNKWNILKCAYMMVTFLFVSYNKGDWCYCHYCSPDMDNRSDPCCSY
ncbi:epididymal protein 13 [Phyllostomus discolor]|uniref:Epididymal protein 13 n=1 Tax=Phyllostomus discolor TaxID=89673 RepID=A0A833YNW4_9CHIR|nr:epididymal protein 13 [Phyllostomus discolor]